jgi:hypothetical protein
MALSIRARYSRMEIAGDEGTETRPDSCCRCGERGRLVAYAIPLPCLVLDRCLTPTNTGVDCHERNGIGRHRTNGAQIAIDSGVILTDRRTAGLEHVRASHWTRVWIALGAGLFIVALFGSAVAVPQLRWLHAFQALIYVAVIFLARKDNALGFGAGTTIAVAWNGIEWSGPHLIQAGAYEFWAFLSTGHLHRPVTPMVFIGAIAHIVLIISCVAAFKQTNRGKKQWLQFLAGGLLALAYFALIVAVLRPH